MVGGYRFQLSLHRFFRPAAKILDTCVTAVSWDPKPRWDIDPYAVLDRLAGIKSFPIPSLARYLTAGQVENLPNIS